MQIKIFALKEKNLTSLYLQIDGKSYYLFSQSFKAIVHEHFRRGLNLQQALSYAKTRGNPALIHTKDKLPRYIRFLEQEEHLIILNKTFLKTKLQTA